jgi:hypothetical protein
VVSSDASEDVVGISKKMLETLVDDLAEPSAVVKDDVLQTEAIEDTPLSTEVKTAPGTITATDSDNSQVSALIVQLQSTFTSRIQRIMGANGGLLVVLEHCTEADEQLVDALSQDDIPIVVIAPQTLRSLQRLG